MVVADRVGDAEAAAERDEVLAGGAELDEFRGAEDVVLAVGAAQLDAKAAVGQERVDPLLAVAPPVERHQRADRAGPGDDRRLLDVVVVAGRADQVDLAGPVAEVVAQLEEEPLEPAAPEVLAGGDAGAQGLEGAEPLALLALGEAGQLEEERGAEQAPHHPAREGQGGLDRLLLLAEQPLQVEAGARAEQVCHDDPGADEGLLVRRVAGAGQRLEQVVMPLLDADQHVDVLLARILDAHVVDLDRGEETGPAQVGLRLLRRVDGEEVPLLELHLVEDDPVGCLVVAAQGDLADPRLAVGRDLVGDDDRARRAAPLGAALHGGAREAAARVDLPQRLAVGVHPLAGEGTAGLLLEGGAEQPRVELRRAVAEVEADVLDGVQHSLADDELDVQALGGDARGDRRRQRRRVLQQRAAASDP